MLPAENDSKAGQQRHRALSRAAASPSPVLHLSPADHSDLSRILRGALGLGATEGAEAHISVEVGGAAAFSRRFCVRLLPPQPAAARGTVAPPYLTHIAARVARRSTVLVPVEELESLEAAAKWVTLRSACGVWSAAGPLRSLVDRLDPQRFLQVSRSVVVSLAQVRTIEPVLRDFVLVMASGTRIRSAASCRPAIRRLLANEPL